MSAADDASPAAQGEDLLLELDVSPLAAHPLISRHIALRSYTFAEVDASPEVLDAALYGWEERARSEYLGVLIFRQLHDLTIDLNAPLDLQLLAMTLMAHENRHAVACAQAARSLGGSDGYVFELGEVQLRRTQQPLSVQLVDQVVTVLCCGEVVAFELLKHTVKALPPSPYLNILKDILKDEVLHGTVGFEILRQIKESSWCPWPGDAHVQQVVAAYMDGLRARDVVDPGEAALFEDEASARGMMALGIPPTAGFKACYFDAIPAAFAPGFAALGISI